MKMHRGQANMHADDDQDRNMHAGQVGDEHCECFLMYAHAQVNLIIKMHQCMLRDAAATDVYYTMLLAKQVSFPRLLLSMSITRCSLQSRSLCLCLICLLLYVYYSMLLAKQVSFPRLLLYTSTTLYVEVVR
jgi:hypothetical protein